MGELCVPGMLSADNGVSFCRLLIHDSSLAVEYSAKNDEVAKYMAVNSNSGFGERGVKVVDRCDVVGVSILYLCSPTSKVSRKTCCRQHCMSVAIVSNGPIGVETLWLLKLSDFSANCSDVGLVLCPPNGLVINVKLPVV